MFHQLTGRTILFSMMYTASNATFSGWKGESPFAISSAFTNSLHSISSGKIVNEAVVFPAPLQPAIILYSSFCLSLVYGYNYN
jgi:hypothetical protein